MQRTIQFKSIVEGGVIHVPEQYIMEIPVSVMVTLSPVAGDKIKFAPRAEAGRLSADDFSALKIDTRDWRFDRNEANERR